MKISGRKSSRSSCARSARSMTSSAWNSQRAPPSAASRWDKTLSTCHPSASTPRRDAGKRQKRSSRSTSRTSGCTPWPSHTRRGRSARSSRSACSRGNAKSPRSLWPSSSRMFWKMACLHLARTCAAWTSLRRSARRFVERDCALCHSRLPYSTYPCLLSALVLLAQY